MVDIESRIDTIEEPDVIQDDPKKWPRRKKFFILGVIAVAGVAAPFSSTYVWIVHYIWRTHIYRSSYKIKNLCAYMCICVYALTIVSLIFTNNAWSNAFRMFFPVLPVIQKSYNTTEVAANSISKYDSKFHRDTEYLMHVTHKSTFCSRSICPCYRNMCKSKMQQFKRAVTVIILLSYILLATTLYLFPCSRSVGLHIRTNVEQDAMFISCHLQYLFLHR